MKNYKEDVFWSRFAQPTIGKRQWEIVWNWIKKIFKKIPLTIAYVIVGLIIVFTILGIVAVMLFTSDIPFK